MQRSTIFLITALLLVSPQGEATRAPVHMPYATLTDPPITTEPLVIVVNRSNPVDDVSFSELRKIFLGTRSHWSNGRRITLVMREPGDPERIAILRDVCGMSEDQLNNHFL